MVELDNVTIWSVKPEENADWKNRKAKFPKYEPVQIKEPKKKKKKAK